ncbi:MAG TPA: histidine kinase [Bacteroidales bacterium]|nr:histidine kinase [Bacteroidales bacterium]
MPISYDFEAFQFGPLSPFLSAAIIFYINYFKLIDRYFISKKYYKFFLINLLIFIFFIIILEYLRQIRTNVPPDFDRPHPHERDHHPDNILFLIFDSLQFKDFITYSISLIFCINIRVTQKLSRSERERQRIEKENIQSTLMLLKYQVQPHFFFNSLNNIYTLIESSPEKAQDALYNLGKLMRYLLYEKESVQLDNEIEFLKKYISLMELRLRENIIIRTSFPEDTGNLKIAPLLFIPLIENAYKHGISSTEPSIISMEMKLSKNKIFFIIENSHFPKDSNDKSGSGIGLQNLEQRLNLIYPNKHQIYKNVENGMFKVQLTIDLS